MVRLYHNTYNSKTVLQLVIEIVSKKRIKENQVSLPSLSPPVHLLIVAELG